MIFKDKIKIVDKYILKQVIVGLIVVSSVLLGIAWFSQIIRLLSYLVNNNLDFLTFMEMTTLLFPDLVVVIVPIALFAVVLFVYNKLVSDKELVIMQAVGMSARRLSRPALWVATALTVVCLYITLYISPIFAMKYRTFAFDAKNNVSALLIQEGEFNQVTLGLTIYVRSSNDNVLSGIFIDDKRTPEKVRTILAERGVISTVDNNITLTLENGSVQEKDGDRFTFGSFNRYSADLGVIAKETVRDKKPNELSSWDLLNAKELGYADELSYPKYLVELHKRVLEPLYNIIFALIALLAIFKAPLNKRGHSKNMIFAVVGMVAVQVFFIISFNALRRHINLWIPVYAVTLLTIVLLFRILFMDKSLISVIKGWWNNVKNRENPAETDKILENVDGGEK